MQVLELAKERPQSGVTFGVVQTAVASYNPSWFNRLLLRYGR